MNNRIALIVLLIFCVNHALKSQVDDKDSLKKDSSRVKTMEEQLAKGDSLNNNSKPVVVLHDGDDEFSNLSKDSTIVGKSKKDTINLSNKNPNKGHPVIATLCSTFVPGLGQAYNKKYWKIPIIYTIFGSMYFFARNNHQKYKDFKFAYKNFDTDLKPIWVNENIKDDYLKDRMEFYKRNRNFNIIIGGIFYLLNILDANVDAHLMDFDVGYDLAMHIEPDFQFINVDNTQIPNFGMKFVFALNK